MQERSEAFHLEACGLSAALHSQVSNNYIAK